MGLTVLRLELANPAAPDRREAVDFLVDFGAVYSFVARDALLMPARAADSSASVSRSWVSSTSSPQRNPRIVAEKV